MSDAPPDSIQNLSVQELAIRLRAEVEKFQPQARLCAPLVSELLSRLDMPVAEVAGELGLAPQTVHRWRNGKTVPRPRQARDLASWIEQREQKTENAPLALPAQSEASAQIGIRFADEILGLEREAKHVWIVKSGVLRECVRGAIGEGVFHALQNGVNFSYVFLEGTPAAQSFKQFHNWLQKEEFSGHVQGFCVSDPHLARAIGLSDSPGAWIGLDYSAPQAKRLGRQFDVFFAVAAREYADASRTQPKNEDGQAVWIELATPYAARWLQTLKESLEGLEKNNWRGVTLSQFPNEV